MSIDTDILGLLLPNILTVAVQLCATFVLFVLLKKLLWKPVNEILEQRSEYEQSKLSEAEKIKEENEQLNKEALGYIEEAKKESLTIIEKAKSEADSQRQQILKQAKEDAEAALDAANKSIAKQKEEAQKEIHDQIVDVALAASERFMSTKDMSKVDQDSIDSFVKEISNERYS